jgi:hypothetical protein
MNLRELYPCRFIASEDFKDKPVTLTVDHVAVEQVGHGSDKESKVIAYFKEPSKATRKPIQLVLCATNAQRIAVMFGKEADDWSGHRVTLGVEMVESFGDIVPAIRVQGSPELTAPIKYRPKKGSRIKPATLVPTPRTGAAATPATPPVAPPTAAPVHPLSIVCDRCGDVPVIAPDATAEDVVGQECACGGEWVRCEPVG